MSTPINDGGPAFPHAHEDYPFQHGMSLRDYFAGQALAGSLAVGYTSPDGHKWMAEHAYAMADAMLAERAKGGAK